MRGLSAIMNDFYDELSHRVNCLTVYIMEAHAADEWPINSSRYNGPCNTITQHKTQQERRDVAALFVEKFNWHIPMVCDDISNAFDAAFAPWPLRFYVIEKGIVTYIAQPKDCSYDIFEFFDFVRQRI